MADAELKSEPPVGQATRSVTRMVGRDTLGQLFGRIVAAGASIVALRLAAVALGPTRYGHVAIALSLVQIMSGIADFGLLAVVTRDMAGAESDAAANILGTAFWLRLFLGAISSIALLAITAAAFGHEPGVFTGVLILSPILITRSVELAYTAWFSTLTRLTTPMIIMACVQLVSLPVLWLLLRSGAGGAGYLGVTTAAAALTALAMAVWSRHPIGRRSRPVGSRGIDLLRKALPFGVVTIVSWVYFRLDGVLLALLRPAAQVAYYSLAYRVVDFVIGLPTLLLLALLPSLVQAEPTRRVAMVQRALDVLIVGAVATCLGVAASTHLIIGVLGGSQFYPAARPLAILGIGAAFSFGSAVYGHALVVLDQQRRMLHVIVVVTIVNLAANLMLIPLWGAVGAALSLVVSELVGLVLLDRAFRQASSTALSWRQLWRLAPAIVAAITLWFTFRSIVIRSDSFLAIGGTVAVVGLVFIVVAATVGALRPLGLAAMMLPRKRCT